MKGTLAMLRILLVIHTALVVAQPVMAGYFLSGEVDAMDVHGPIGSTLWTLTFIQFFVAILYWRPGGGRLWPAVATIVLFLAEFAQMAAGYTRTRSVHIPLGTSIVVGVVLFTIWSFRPSARRGRARKDSSTALQEVVR